MRTQRLTNLLETAGTLDDTLDTTVANQRLTAGAGNALTPATNFPVPWSTVNNRARWCWRYDRWWHGIRVTARWARRAAEIGRRWQSAFELVALQRQQLALAMRNCVQSTAHLLILLDREGFYTHTKVGVRPCLLSRELATPLATTGALETVTNFAGYRRANGHGDLGVPRAVR